MARRKRLYLSGTAMGYYRECPAKFWHSRHWRVVGVAKPIYFEIGEQAHGILAGTLKRSQARNEAVLAADALKTMEKSEGLKIIDSERESRQKFRLDGKGFDDDHLIEQVTWTRYIDGRGTNRRGHDTLMDYKTAGYEWDVILASGGEWLAPQSMGVQAVAYLIPHDEDVKWPDRIVFLVNSVKPKKANSSFEYRLNPADLREFYYKVWAIERDWKEGRVAFCRERGYACTRCQFAGMCFKTPGYKQYYEKLSVRRKKKK